MKQRLQKCRCLSSHGWDEMSVILKYRAEIHKHCLWCADETTVYNAVLLKKRSTNIRI